MAAAEVLPLDQIEQDARRFINRQYTADISLRGLYLHGSAPNQQATPSSDLDILFVLPDGLSSLDCATVESFSETYGGFPADAFAVPADETTAYLRASCERNGYEYVYDVFARTQIQYTAIR